MTILGIDCSAVSASVAVVKFEDSGSKSEKILSFSYTNIGLTHSQTLVPMINFTLENAGLTLSDIDYFAINAGPGSFTGVRIGVAALKGMTEFEGDICFGVSTLESMAYNFRGITDGVICAAMDARCGQVYTACFELKGLNVTRLTEDTAISIKELGENLKSLKKSIIFVGDGASLCYNNLSEELESSLAPSHLVYQNAVSVAICAKDLYDSGTNPVSGERILPVYLRAPQAQRELKKGSH